jgi:hypothetical protein
MPKDDKTIEPIDNIKTPVIPNKQLSVSPMGNKGAPTKFQRTKTMREPRNTKVKNSIKKNELEKYQ